MRPTPNSLLTALFICIFFVSCSGGSAPLQPGLEDETTETSGQKSVVIAPNLWGYYDVEIDPLTEEVFVSQDRSGMFTANVTTFLNSNPATLGFAVKEVVPGQNFTDVDIDVSITHPFSGLPQYNGYDVRGIFIGDQSATLSYDDEVKYPRLGIDQMITKDPDDAPGIHFSDADGYTRWFNPTEFKVAGLHGYLPGLFSTIGFKGTATINGYKYFGDSLGTSDFLMQYLNSVNSDDGVFSSGKTNIRNYYLRFPDLKGIKFNYAVIANWKNESTHPSNAPEALACRATVTENLWYQDADNNGGHLVTEIEIFDWNSDVDPDQVMRDYKIYIDSTVLDSTYELSLDEMKPIAQQGRIFKYGISILADNVPWPTGNEFWVIVEYPSKGYFNDPGVINYAQPDPLASFFRFDLPVAGAPFGSPPVCDLQVDPANPMPYSDFAPAAVTFDASGSYDPDTYDELFYSWDFNDDGIFDGPGDEYVGPVATPTHYYDASSTDNVSVKVTDGNLGESICSLTNIDVTAFQSRNIPLRTGVDAVDLAVDPVTGDMFVVYADKLTYRYDLDNGYSSGAIFAGAPPFAGTPYIVDLGTNGYMLTGGTYSIYTASWAYDNAGAYISIQFGGLGWMQNFVDVTAMSPNGSFVNDLGILKGGVNTSPPNERVIELHRFPSPIYPSTGVSYKYQFTGNQFDGEDRIYYLYVVGIENDLNEDSIWVLETANDFGVSKWDLTTATNELTYANVFFGQGGAFQSDETNEFNDPKDITRDNTNRLFILDILSSAEPSVKVWEVTDDVPANLGAFGDSTDISGTAMRIEGSDYDGKIVVLHDNGATDMVSVFQPVEMP